MHRARSPCATVAFGVTELVWGATLRQRCLGEDIDNGRGIFGLHVCAWVVHGPWNLCPQIDAHKN